MHADVAIIVFVVHITEYMYKAVDAEEIKLGGSRGADRDEPVIAHEYIYIHIDYLD